MSTSLPPYLDASAQLLYLEATRRGIDCKTFPDTQIIAMSQGDKHWYTTGCRTSFQSAVGQTIADDKAISKVFLKEAQAPTARSVVVKTALDLVQLADLTWPLVMKPVKGAHGRGIVIGLADLAAATAAFTQAQTAVLFEETLQGTEYRILCFNYQFVAAAYRKPAHVIGDGQHTIEELVAIKNQHPWRDVGHHGKLTQIIVDDVVTATLAEQHFTLQNIPPPDQEVLLRHTANLSTGGEAWDVTDEVGAENRRLFERIAKTCDLNIIGIDVMCDSLSLPLAEQPKAGIIEINKSPGLRMHHFPLRGTSRDIARLIIDDTLVRASRS